MFPLNLRRLGFTDSSLSLKTHFVVVTVSIIVQLMLLPFSVPRMLHLACLVLQVAQHVAAAAVE